MTGDHWGDRERGGSGPREPEEEIRTPLLRRFTPGNLTGRGRAASALWFGTGGNNLNPGNTKVELTVILIDEQQKLLLDSTIYVIGIFDWHI